MATTPKVLINRTPTNNNPPASLQEGELSLEMGTPTRLWAGVPIASDPSGKKLLYDSSAATGGGGLDQATADGLYVNIVGDTMTGPLVLPVADPTTPRHATHKQYVDGRSYTKAESDTNFVNITGDTMTGDLILTKPGGAGSWPILTIDHTTGNASAISGKINGQPRWMIQLGDDTPETGVNSTGSIFGIYRYGDGSLVPEPVMQFARTWPADCVVNTGNYRTLIGGIGCKEGDTNVQSSSYVNFHWSGSAVTLYVDTTWLGPISIASDYRIKKDVAPLPDMWATVKGLRPIKYTLTDYTPADKSEPLIKNDSLERWGFIAHELQEDLILSAASGVKDQPNGLQSPNLPTVVAALTKALQQAMLRIEALEASILARR